MNKALYTFKNGPDNYRGFFFMLLIRAFNYKLFKYPRWLIKYLILGISPNVPYDLIAFFRKQNRWVAFILIYLITFCTTFLVFYIWTKAIGTYKGNDPDFYYFSQDKNNLLNYTIIVPLYISLGAALLSTIVRSIGNYNIQNQFTPKGLRQFSPYLTFGLAFAVAVIVTVNYIGELRDPARYTQNFWCFNKISAGDERVLSAMGIYYTLVTFVLMLLSVLFIISIFAFFKFSISFSKEITPKNYKNSSEVSLIKNQLKDFITVYILAKLLAGIYILNYYTWVNQSPVDSDNLVLMKIAITFFALSFVALPRYYIENQWYDFKLNLFFQNKIPKAEYEKILSRPQSLLISFVDLFLIGNIISDLWIQKSVVDILSSFY